MELLQLKYFCDAAETENFTVTAKKFTVPTSNISQSVKRLERELGTELFEHRANKILLSDKGRLFYEKVSRALELLDEGRAALCEGEEPSGEIRLLILCNRRMITKAIEVFKARYPKVSFVLRHGKDNDFEPDILISDSCPPSYFEKELLTEEEILLAMHRSHPLAEKEKIKTEELSGERFISMPKHRSLYTLTERICHSAGFTPNISIQSDDPHYIREYVELGLGIAFIPAASWEGLFSENTVLKRIGDYTRRTYICLPKGRAPKRAVEEFLSYLKI